MDQLGINTQLFQAVLVFIISMILFYVTIKILMGASQGNVKQASQSVGVVLLASIPAALGVTALWLTAGENIVNAVFGN
ncbi:MAG: hypothetical protein ACRCYR_03645 [Phycicoccus sp.]